MAPKQVEAAGGLVWNKDGLVAVVHRPRYDDWSFPKGKRHKGETLQQCALREVREETGFRCSLGEALDPLHYLDHKGRPKTVYYWHMTVISGHFVKNDEVDELRWVDVVTAKALLSYQQDIDLLGT